MILFENSVSFSEAYYNPISKEMHIVLKSKELYVVKNVSLEEFNSFGNTNYPDNFFEEYFLAKEPEKVSIDFEEIYQAKLLKDE